MADLEDELVASLRARLAGDLADHARFVGPPVDIRGLSPLGLGRLLAPMRSVAWSKDHPTASALAHRIKHEAAIAGIVPALDAESGLEIFRGIAALQWSEAIEHLGYLVGKPSPELQVELRRILGDPTRWDDDASPWHAFKALALLRWGDGTEQQLEQLHASVRERWADWPLRLAEFEVLQHVGLAALLALARTMGGYYVKGDADEGKDPAVELADDASYVAFAKETLEAAVRRLDDIHSGRAKYESDKAFDFRDAHVIARCVRVAAYRDDAWLRPLILALLPGVCVAPTAAKTVPSQSVAMALGHAVAAIPTPEGVRALREALAVVRHAGVKKKLLGHLKPAERGLGARPELALRLAASVGSDHKKHRAMLATCLEAAFWQGFDLSPAEWRERLAETPGGQPFARGLVWTAQVPGAAPIAFMVDPNQPGLALVDAAGQPVALPAECRIGLWHPARVDADERSRWLARLASLRMVQPLRQVFREHYRARPEERASHLLRTFVGHELSIRPLLGLARREGWRLDGEAGLTRRFGDVRATFVVGAQLYPGAEGYAQSQEVYLALHRGRAWCSVPIDALDPVVVSEVCRAVDLLVSVAAFAIEDGTGEMPLTVRDLGLHVVGQPAPEAPAVVHPRVRRRSRLEDLSELPLGETARMRGKAMRLALAGPIAEGRATVGERHIHVGDFAVHLATARVTENGAPVDLELPAKRAKLAALPWLPYDEALLQRIADAVGALLERTVVGRG